jgi:hypothetical protein
MNIVCGVVTTKVALEFRFVVRHANLSEVHGVVGEKMASGDNRLCWGVYGVEYAGGLNPESLKSRKSKIRKNGALTVCHRAPVIKFLRRYV